MSVITATDWTRNFEGEFRVYVLDQCPHCNVKLAHAVEYRGGDTKCQVCLKVVELPGATSPGEPTFSHPVNEVPVAVPTAPIPDAVFQEAQAPTVITSYRTHREHHLTCTACRPGRSCDDLLDAFDAMKRDEAARRTPWVATLQFGRVLGCWDERSARAYAGVMGGEVIDQTHLYQLG